MEWDYAGNGLWVEYTLDDGEVIIREGFSLGDQNEVLQEYEDSVNGWVVYLGEDIINEPPFMLVMLDIFDLNEEGGIA